MTIKKGDTVVVLTGSDKGKKGKVLTAIPKKDRVVVEGVGEVTKRRRPRRGGEKGQSLKVHMPIHISNVKKV